VSAVSAHLAPNSPPAMAAHRLVLAWGLARLSGRSGPRAEELRRALAGAAAGRLADAEREALASVEVRRAEIPFDVVDAGLELGIVPGDATEAAAAEASAEAAAEPANRAERLAQAWEICRWTSISPVWGRFLALLVRALEPRSALELGTGLGLSGAYQASALELNGAGRLVTLDVHEASRVAERGFAQLGLSDRIELRFGLIDETLPDVLAELDPVEFAFLDAEHSLAATVRHFDLVLPHLADGAVVVLDDIAQTREMRLAWAIVSTRRRVALSLALRRMGVVVCGPPG
jgi:predicted O-methyltransferase YrrM